MIRVPDGGRGRWGRRLGAINLAAVLALSGTALGALPPAAVEAQAPDEAWRTISTEHFRVTFPERLEPLARRAAERAEWAYGVLEPALVEPPEGAIDVVVTDHADVSNGFARIWPSNRITVYARPPVDEPSLAYFDDWMELVVLHELAHIVHLDHQTNPIGRVARAIFGRVQSEWPFFPQAWTPRWVVEGLATWYESHLTDAGRVHGTFQEMQLRTAAIEGRFESIGQASGRSPLWPAGHRPYTYGARFFEYLLDKHGPERMADFVDAIGGQWIPYRLDAAGRDAFGASLSEEWRAWSEELSEEYAGLEARLAAFAPITEAERLTTDARWGWHPRVSPDGASLAYVRSDGRSDLQLRVVDAHTGAVRRTVRTNGLATYEWLPDGGILLAQLELEGPYRAYGDLHVVDADGRERRLTRGARLSDPSPHPTEAWAVAVRHGDGSNGLVRVSLEDGSVTSLVAPEPDVHWAYPRLSPDGRWIAATRWEPEAYSDVVVLDAGTGAVAARVTRDRAVDVAPSWAPDGAGIVWSSDRTGIPNVLGATFDASQGRAGPARLLTNVRTGATYPSVDPSGSWLYFSGYHVDGWDVERVPYRLGAAPEAPGADARFAASAPPRARGGVDAPVERYSPVPTLLPKYWEISYREPLVFPGIVTGDDYALRRREAYGHALGMQTSGLDLVGRHAYSAFARVFLEEPKVDAGVAYTFAGLGNPLFSVVATQTYDALGQLAQGTAPDTLLVVERERRVEGVVRVRVPSYRADLAFTLRGGLVWEKRDLLDHRLLPATGYALQRPTSRLTDAGVGVSFSTARSHSFQMGLTRGVLVSVQARRRADVTLPDSLAGRYAVDRSLDETTATLRAGVPLWSTGRVTHVLALRGSAGVASGPGATALHFDVGGTAGRPEQVSGAELFGGSFLLFPVRGYPVATRFGRNAWSATAEYRFPLGIVNRGLGAWPLHFDRLAGSLYLDAGNAWGPNVTPTGFENRRRADLVSTGAEVTAELLALYDVSTRVRWGVALPLVEVPGVAGASLYVRIGLSF